jgi:GNAT superfamily N-acetyltransferase
VAEFETMILDDPALSGDARFIATDQSELLKSESSVWVGMSNLWLNDPAHTRLDTGLTGVVRGHRRRGIATALKIRTIEYATQLGAQSIETGNEENNPIVELNRMLGFRPRAAWISYRKEFSAT